MPSKRMPALKKAGSRLEITVSRIPGKSQKVPLAKGETVSSLLSRLGVNRETVLVRVSGKMAPDSRALSSGEKVEIISIISGG